MAGAVFQYPAGDRRGAVPGAAKDVHAAGDGRTDRHDAEDDEHHDPDDGPVLLPSPAGLCIYFITSSLWGICERIMVKKTLPTGKHFDSAVLEGTATATEKSQSLVDRIRSQVAKPKCRSSVPTNAADVAEEEDIADERS